MSRNDLTNWIIHFVHRRNPDNDPLEFSYDFEDMEYEPYPDSFTYEGKPIFKTQKYEEDDYGLESDAYAIGVLKKFFTMVLLKLDGLLGMENQQYMAQNQQRVLPKCLYMP
jgi:hypothetical protein